MRVSTRLHKPRQPRQMGRPRVVGQRLPQLDQVLFDPHAVWHKAWVHGMGKANGRSNGAVERLCGIVEVKPLYPSDGS
jgi:hypothetical protein